MIAACGQKPPKNGAIRPPTMIKERLPADKEVAAAPGAGGCFRSRRDGGGVRTGYAIRPATQLEEKIVCRPTVVPGCWASHIRPLPA